MSRLAWFLLPVMLLAGSSVAGTTGAIAGVVTDYDGNPVIGAAVAVEGAALGAFTDQNGEYFVYNLPPGEYSVTSRMVGLSVVTKDGVHVLIDQVTRVDFELGLDPAGHTVIEVRDQRSLILENVPSTIHVLDRDEIKLMPVADILDVVARQPGVISQGGAIHVRGGRAGEVDFLLDGIPVRSPLTSATTSVVPLSALEQTSMVTGGASAEYGNAMSGIVTMVTRDGGPGYEGEVDVRYGDMMEFGSENVGRNYSEGSENDDYRGDAINVECALGGPEPLFSHLLPMLGLRVPGTVRFFGTANILISGRNLEDSRGYWENNWQKGFSGSFKLTATPVAGTTISGLGYYYYRQSGWDEWAWCHYDEPAYIEGDVYLGGDPDYAIPIRFQETGGVTASLTQVLSQTAFLDVRLNQNRFCRWNRIRDPEGGYFGEGFSPSDWLTVFAPQPRLADSLGFFHSGMHPEVFLDSRSLVTNGRTNLTWRPSNLVELKTGVDGTYYDIFDYSAYQADAGNMYASLWRAYPSAGAAHVQATLRFGAGMVINSGVRFDIFNPNATAYDFEEGGEYEVSVKSQVSPRFGITHPVTERDVFFATYGHYFQMPSLNEMFFGSDMNISSSHSLMGNPDLDAERTVAYEAGVRHRFTDTSSLAFSAFYKDITGLVRTAEHYTDEYSYFYQYENDDSHGSVRGFEVKLLKLPGDRWSGSVGYCYSVARGRYSSPTEAYDYYVGGVAVDPSNDNYLDWDQTHTADAHLTVSIPRDEGPQILGARVLQGVGLSIDWSYGSGFPFSSPATGGILPGVNTERYPWTMQTDLGLTKTFWSSPFQVDFGLTVHNLFNRRNVDRIFDTGHYLDTGSPGGISGNPGAWSPARSFNLRASISW